MNKIFLFIILSFIFLSCSDDEGDPIVVDNGVNFFKGKTFLTPAGVTKEECDRIIKEQILYNCFSQLNFNEDKGGFFIFTDIGREFEKYEFKDDTLKIITKNTVLEGFLSNPFFLTLNKEKNILTDKINDSTSIKWILEEEGKDPWRIFED